MDTKEKLDKERIPKHIAVVMDGNGRWAMKQGFDRNFGHLHGVKPLRDITAAAAQLGVKYLTAYAFSTENWNRPIEEVNELMKLLINTLKEETPILNKNNIRLNAIGNLEALPEATYQNLQDSLQETAQNTGMVLNIALSYSARWEIANATKLIAQKVKNNEIDIESITEQTIADHLTTAGMPDPDLMIRTSGELRISNYLLWQLSYSELYFTDTLWPDFNEECLYKAIYEYQNRNRRFGK